MKLVTSLLRLPSVFVHKRLAFFALMAAAAGIKLTMSAIAPASYDMQAWQFFRFTSPPWVVLETSLFEVWNMLTSSNVSLDAWSTTPPQAMAADLRFLSVLIRLPAFAFDILMAAALYLAASKFTGDANLARLTSLVWFLNPYTLFAAELLAVPDVLVALLTLVSALCLLQGRPILSAILLFSAVGLKLYPILLLPAILIHVHKYSVAKRQYWFTFTACGLLGVAAYLSWLLQDIDLVQGRNMVLLFTVYNPVSQPFAVLGVFSSSIPLSVAMAALVIVYFFAWNFARDSSSASYLIHLYSVVLLTYFVFSDFHPQYFMWVLPFITLDVALFNRRRLVLLFVLLVALFGSWFISSFAFLTPSRYSLLLIPLEGPGLPSYSLAIREFLQSLLTKLVLLPLLEDAMYAVAVVYVIAIVIHWYWNRQAGTQGH